MAAVLGIDIGTSGTKVMLLNTESGEQWVEKESYDIMIPQTGYAEQNPDLWWHAVVSCLQRMRRKKKDLYCEVSVIGLSGQMHGLVMTDENGRPIRPAILWNDQRSEEECGVLRRLIPDKLQKECLKNWIFPGFAFPSLFWVRSHEPEVFGQAVHVMQAKDYVRFRMTGCIGAEVSDASATLMFDIVKRDWAWEILELCGMDESLFSDCHESVEIQGTLSKTCIEETGLPKGAQVIYGAGDQQSQSIGNGVLGEGTFICNIGTGGQVSSFAEEPVSDQKMRTHTFCHGIPGAWSVYGAVLNAGMALKWLKNQILETDSFETLNRLAQTVPAGSEGLIFLPYLTGERTPHMDPGARGGFCGLHLAHTRAHMARAVMEGVTFALKDCMDILKEMGLSGDRVISSGGGASSPVWLQIQSDVFGKEVQVLGVQEQACLGACMMAAVAAGHYRDLKEASDKLVNIRPEIYAPDPERHALYQEQIRRYRKLYRQIREV